MKLPEEIQKIIHTLRNAGYEGYAVGGCVRDLLLKETPTDWDITTNASPEDIQRLFPDSFYENTFGTVTVKSPSELSKIQITPYRTETKYTDKRHPDEIHFAQKLEDDLSRRDFTINAMALDVDENLTDLFDGQKDLKKRVIRTVGDPQKRFSEDALRILRAVRFATTMKFTIEPATLDAIKENSHWLKEISHERIRDELTKIVDSPSAADGIELLEKTEILQHLIPELREGIDVEQNLHHIYTVWEHNIRALRYAAEKNYSSAVRFAALLHDVAKPRTKRGEGKYSTFYAHNTVGSKMTKKILARLRFPREFIEKVTILVCYHLFYYNVGEVTESSVRRLLAKVGMKNMEDLLKVREADRIGSGTPKAVPYKLRHLKYMIDKVSHDPISVKMLNIDGNTIMELLEIESGPKVGLLLRSLLAEILDDPLKNTKEYLKSKVKELNKQSPEKLQKALKKIEEAQKKEEDERMNKYYV